MVKRTLTIIFIRHGKKQFSNGKGPKNSYQHDSPISEDEISLKEINDKSQELISKYSKPNYCITSPYFRCRQTLTLLLNKIRSSIFIDPLLSEFLGNQKPYIKNGYKNYVPLVAPETLKYNPPEIKEPFKNMYFRSEECLNKIFEATSIRKNVMRKFNDFYEYVSLEAENKQENIVVWVVTHGIIISSIYNILQEDYELIENYSSAWYDRPDILQGICITKTFGEIGEFTKI